MNKFKIILLVILVAVLVDFAVENNTPTQVLRFFTFTLRPVPTFLLAYAGLALGLVVGWIGHTLRIRKKRRQTLSQEQQAQQGQQGQEAAQ